MSKKSEVEAKTERLLRKAGVSKVNTPRLTPSHPEKKAVVVASYVGKKLVGSGEKREVKLIRFGDQNSGHNYSPEARRNFKARHAKSIARGPMSPAFWSDKFLWAGPKGHKKNPPKGQNRVYGKIKGKRPD